MCVLAPFGVGELWWRSSLSDPTPLSFTMSSFRSSLGGVRAEHALLCPGPRSQDERRGRARRGKEEGKRVQPGQVAKEVEKVEGEKRGGEVGEEERMVEVGVCEDVLGNDKIKIKIELKKIFACQINAKIIAK
jgi:hypothetical protein